LPRPSVSVVVPVFNGERYLAGALDSVLGQTYPAAEVIVVDDGSTDSSARIAASRPVKCLQQANAGRADARNAGIAASRGDLIGFLDHDDIWLPEKLSKQVELMEREPELGAVSCGVEVILEPGTPPPPWLTEHWARTSWRFVPSAMLVRRSVFDRVGLFDRSYRVGEDSDWLLRARDAGLAMEVVAEVLYRYRIHHDNSLHQTRAHAQAMFRILRESMARKRAAEGPLG